MIRSLLIVVSVFLVFGPTQAVAQRPEGPTMTWGEVSAVDLAATTCPLDSTADAYVLFDYGETHLNDFFQLNFQRHLRVKILKASAFDGWGSYSVPFYAKDNREHVKKVAGITYVLASDGSVQKNELGNDAIFMVDQDKEYAACRFTLPALTPGCIVDVRYEIDAKGIWNIQDWTFQQSVPVRWSEYKVTIPKNIVYAGVKIGYESFCIDEITKTKQRISGETYRYLQVDAIECNQYHWAMRDVPAIHEEPFMTTLKDYTERIELQLAEYVFPESKVEKVLDSWEKLVEDFTRDPEVGKAIDVTGDVRTATARALASCNASEDTLEGIYNYVRRNIAWDGHETFFTRRGVDDVLETKKGSTADINYLLMSMLRCAGRDVVPVISSTRNHGKVQLVYPIASQFNHVVAGVRVGGTTCYLDATDRLRPRDLLPLRVLNTRGLLIREGPVEWVGLTTTKSYDEESVANVSLTSNGEIHGTMKVTSREYASLFHRKDLKDGNEADVLRKMIDAEQLSLTLDSVHCDGIDSVLAPLTFSAALSSTSYAQAAGDLLYVNPHLLGRVSENPLKAPTRKFPIDMSYPRHRTVSVSITIPDGYDIKEMPSDRTSKAGKDVLYKEEYKVVDRTIVMNAVLQFTASEFPAGNYSRLKEFYQRLTVLGAGQIVLQRAKAAVKPPKK